MIIRYDVGKHRAIVFVQVVTLNLYKLSVNLLQPTGCGMQLQVEHFHKCTLCPHRVYVFCVCLRTNSDLYHLQYILIVVYNRDEKFLQRGTDWVFK
jgi:hypothetical protein